MNRTKWKIKQLNVTYYLICLFISKYSVSRSTIIRFNILKFTDHSGVKIIFSDNPLSDFFQIVDFNLIIPFQIAVIFKFSDYGIITSEATFDYFDSVIIA